MSRERRDDHRDTGDASVGGSPAVGQRTRVAARYPALARSLPPRDEQPTIADAATAAVEHKSAGVPVDAEVAGRVGAQLGADFREVRVHDDPLAQDAAGAMAARAFAHGGDVFLGAGESATDLGLMAHELTHVAQQGAAGQRATQRKVEVGDPASPAEAEADGVAAAVVGGAPPSALLVDDGAVAAEQMLKESFLAELRAAVTAAADAELGPAFTAIGCPYIEQYFDRYAGRPASDVEALLRRYAADTRGARSAAAMIPMVVERVRVGVRHWRDTGQAPADLPAAEAAVAQAPPPPAPRDVPPAALRAPDGRETLASLEADLGPGRALDGATASRMSDGLGIDVSRAQLHTGPVAARKAADADAVAFAVGPHVVMGAAAPAAGTLEGDALLAHELAHVDQQRGESADPMTRREPIADEDPAAEHEADEAAGSALSRLWGGAKSAMRRLTGASKGLSLQRCQDKATAAAEKHAAALQQELGVTVVTAPEVGGDKTAYVGGQVQFGLDFAHPPQDRKIQATAWSLQVPGGGGFSQVPSGPTTMLPITQVGRHRFVVTIEVDDRTTFEVAREFDAIEPGTRTDALVKDQQGLPLSHFQSQLALQEAMLSPPGPVVQGKGAALQVATSVANPARQADRDPATLRYEVHDADAGEGASYHWYLKPFRWDGLPAVLGGQPKVALDEGGEAYDLGAGRSASFPASHQGTYLVVCRAYGADRKPRGDARYLQSVLTADSAAAVEKVVAHEDRVGGFAGRFEGATVPVVGSHVAVQTGTETELRLYLGRAKGDPGRWLLIDMTPGLDPEQNELEFDGSTVESALAEFEDDNRYPKGALSLRIDANPIGAPPLTRRFDTDGKTILNSLSTKAGLLSLLLGLGAIIAAPFTGGGSLLVTALIVGSATAAATAGVLSLADHLATEEVDETAIALDVLTIATSFLNAGLAVKALRGGPAMVLASRGGRFLLWTNVAIEGVSAVLIAVDGAEQIVKIVESDAPADDKMRALVAVVANMILTGTLMVVSYGDVKAMRGRLRGHVGKAVDGLADADHLTLALLDDQTLTSLKAADAKQLNRLADMMREDPSLLGQIAGRADLVDALKLARGARAVDLELAFLQLRLKSAGVAEAAAERMLRALDVGGLTPARIRSVLDAALAKLAGPAVLDQLEPVAALQKSGRVKGLDDWLDAAKTGATDPGELALELREAVRQTREKPDAIIHIGGDARAGTRPGSTEPRKSFDMTAETAGGKVSDSIEVTSIGNPLRTDAGLRPGVEHGIAKVKSRIADGAPIPGKHEVTILGTIHPPKTTRGGTETIDPTTGDRTVLTHETPRREVKLANLYDNMAAHMPKIPDHDLIDTVTLVDAKSGGVLVTFRRQGATWSVVR